MMESLTLKQIKTLLFRNYLLTRRKKSQTGQMILFPIYFVVLLVVLKVSVYRPTNYSSMSNEETLNFQEIASNFSVTANQILIAPNNSGVIEFKEKLENHAYARGNNFSILSSQDEMDAVYRANPSVNIIGILFEGSSLYNYTLRFDYSVIPGPTPVDFNQNNCRSVNILESGNCPSSSYITSRFLSLQSIIDEVLIKDYNPDYQFPEITLQRMPRVGAIVNAEGFTFASAIYLVFAFTPFMIILLVNVVTEKQLKIKEAMKVMGLGNFALWFSWSLTYGVIIFFMAVIMSVIAVFGTLFEHSNFFLIFLLFFLYGLSIEMLGFMLTPFFINAKTAGTAAGFINLLFGLLYLVVAFVQDIPVGAIWALNLLAPTGFATAIGGIAVLEVAGVGAQFSNLWSTEITRYPVGITFVMLAADIFLYFILILYFDRIIPGEYGKAEPVYFFLLPSYWFPSSRAAASPSNLPSSDFPAEDCEPISEDLRGREAIRFSNITKIYRSMSLFQSERTPVTAVNNFSLDIYEGQITALLGHNGAGKTTLFNILTGFTETTSGRTTVFNHDIAIAGELEKVRRMTGFCPQHNVLFDVLSVQEHLRIFAGIKGIPDNAVAAEVDRIIKLIGLQDQADTLSKKLSGGQKRKLSVGIAIMGNPKILILDEPTAGMDPYSRHSLWNVLRQRKGDRVTLLTTHFMDEADILAAVKKEQSEVSIVGSKPVGRWQFVLEDRNGTFIVFRPKERDRKAVISRGRLRCVGSSLFLKNRFGVGYHLGIVTKSTRDHSDLTDLVIGHVIGAKLQRMSGFELGYTLPITEVGKFSKLFYSLETEAEKLDVQSFGVSMTTLEEVFLKIGEEDEGEDEDEGEQTGLQRSNNDIVRRLRSLSSIENDTGNTNGGVARDQTKFDPTIGKVGKPSAYHLFFAIIKVRMMFILRSPGYLFFGLLIPLALSIGGAAVLASLVSIEDISDPPSFNLTGGASSGYLPLLYNNSPGTPLNNFRESIEPYSNQESSLENLYQNRGVPSYMGVEIRQFETNQTSYRALYNVSGVHSIPAIFNLMSYSALKAINSSAPSIRTLSKRWPATTQVLLFNGAAFGGVLMSALAVMTTAGVPMLLPVMERELKIRNQLRVSGVLFNMYWLATFFIDYIWYLVIVLGYFIGISAFDVMAFVVPGAVIAQVFLFIGCGIASILTSYCLSFLFNKFETVSSSWSLIIQLVTLLPYLVVSLVDSLGSPSVALVFNIIFVILIPYYPIFSGLYYISKIFDLRRQMGVLDDPPTHIYFDWSEPMIPFSILMSYLHIIIVFILLRVIDVRANGGKVSDVFMKRSAVAAASDQLVLAENVEGGNEDGDVRDERRRVCDIVAGNGEQEQPVVIMQNLRKEFVKRTKSGFCKRNAKEEKVKVAVDNLSLVVQPGEVLGLLGPNGAGKTTAISVLTAERAPTLGKVFVSGYDIASNESQAFQEMGFCSQDNPLWELITLREHLEVYAVAHGVDQDSVDMTINNYVDALDIREHLNKRAKQLSGGTKRKLCFAMAMMGNPQVVLLDEPSTGMDPKTKRFMWDTISSAFAGSDRGAILTTHYMEEADALCSRVAIMVLGQLRCIGSTQHLKNKFGQGYVLEIKLKANREDGDDALNVFVAKLFAHVSQPERFSHRFVYKIAQEDVTSLAQVFGTLEEGKEEMGIEEYSFSQSTLEQVFLQFAKEQDERENEES